MEHTERMKPDTAFSIIWDRCQHCKETEEAIKALKKEIRLHGEWIPCNSTRTDQVTNIDYKCSECSHHKDRPMPYCEICGAIMKRSEKK